MTHLTLENFTEWSNEVPLELFYQFCCIYNFRYFQARFRELELILPTKFDLPKDKTKTRKLAVYIIKHHSADEIQEIIGQGIDR
eukprot:UN03470